MPDRRHHTGNRRALVLGSLFVLGLVPTVSAQVAVRDLSDFTTHTQPFIVTITVTPPAGTIAYGIEDATPSDWTDVSNIDNGGSWDAIHQKVKWGPYFTDQPVTLHYTLAPPIPATGGTPCFRGVVSVDGNNQTVAGQGCLPARSLQLGQEDPAHQRPGRARAAVQKDGGQQRLQPAGEDRGLGPAAALGLPHAEAHMCAQVEALGDPGQVRVGDQVRLGT